MTRFALSRKYPPSRRKIISSIRQTALPFPLRVLSLLVPLLLLPCCDSWTPPERHYSGLTPSLTRQKEKISSLEAVTKRQSFVLDGAELSYYIQSLLAAQPTGKESANPPVESESNNAIFVPDVAPKSPKKRNRVGYLTFVTALAEEDIYWDERGSDGESAKPWICKGQRFIGVEVGGCNCLSNTTDTDSSLVAATTAAATTGNNATKGRATVTIDNNSTILYRDSIAILPPSSKTISDADAISTASVALLGVHCALPPGAIDRMQLANNRSEGESEKRVKEAVAKVADKRGKAVIVGGGEYAVYLCKAMVACDVQTSLVSDRPKWSLPSVRELLPKGTTTKQAKKDKMVEILSPSVGQLSLGFAMAIGEFDTLIDTLGDEMGIGRLRSVIQGAGGVSGFLAQMQELHGCSKYISTLTRSQQYVLNKGLLFARDPVIRYQQEVEKLPIMRKCQNLPPPLDFGLATLQTLLDKGVIYPSTQNENGAHAPKSAFVRGWSLSDLTELKTWPRNTKTGTGRFGFPEVKLSLSSTQMLKKMKEEIYEENNSSLAMETQSQLTTLVEVKKNENSLQSKPLSDANITTSSVSEIRHITNSTDFNNTDSIIIESTKTKKTKVTTNSSGRNTTPFVTSIKSASDLNNLITERKRNCILFVKASFCKKCRSLFPQYVHIARLASESAPSVMFAHLDISSSAREKQLGTVLGVDKVPSIVIFRDGQPVKGENGESSKVIEKRVMKELEDAAKSLEVGEGKTLDVLLKMASVKK